MILYDRSGMPTAYTEDLDNIFLFSGQPVAYLFKNMIYGFNGKHLGWFENGWIRDLRGACVFFSEYAHGIGPTKPIKRNLPIKRVKLIKPIRTVRHVPRLPAIMSLLWSPLSGKEFFSQ